MKKLICVITLFICFLSLVSFSQKVEIHYMVIDTLETKIEFLKLVKAYEGQKEFSKTNVSFYLCSKRDYKDSTWLSKSKVFKLFYSKIPCNSNLDQVLHAEENIMNQLNSKMNSILVCNKATLNEIDFNTLIIDWKPLSMNSELMINEKLKELVKIKIKKDLHIIVIQNKFSFQAPKVSLEKNKVFETTLNQLPFQTSTPYIKLNLGNGFSLNGPNSLSLSPTTSNYTTISYIDGLGCVSNTDTLTIESPKECTCETLKDYFCLSRSYLNTMKLVENRNINVFYKWKISPQQNGTSKYCFIIQSGSDCFDAVDLELSSNDIKTLMNTTTIRVEKIDMTKLPNPGVWQFCFDLSIDNSFIKNPKVFTNVNLIPIVNGSRCVNFKCKESIKFSSCSINGEEE